MQMTKGAVNGVPALIDFDRNEFADFPPDHELIFNDGQPTGFQVSSKNGTLPLHQLAWQVIPFNARVYGQQRRRAPR